MRRPPGLCVGSSKRDGPVRGTRSARGFGGVVHDLGHFHIVQPAPDFLDRGDEGLRGDDIGVEDDECGVHLPVRIELDVGPDDPRQVIEFLADLGDAGDLAHHARDGELGHRFLSGAGTVHVVDGDVTLRTA